MLSSPEHHLNLFIKGHKKNVVIGFCPKRILKFTIYSGISPQKDKKLKKIQ